MKLDALDNLILFCGSVNAMETRVRAWLPGAVEDDLQLTGSVLGPHCDFARTLPATVPFRPTTASSGIQSVAVVPDPCLWTPELPMLYDVRVELRRGDTVIATAQRPLAIRKFEPRGCDLNLSGKRWVLRGVRRKIVPHGPLTSWREAGAAMLLTDLDEALATEAARLGVPLVAMIGGTTRDEIAAELRRLARCPAVLLAAIEAGANLPDDIGLAAIDIRLAAYSRAENAPAVLPAWANLLLCESVDAIAIGRAVAGREYPVIALCPRSEVSDIAAARAACDLLQRDLAPFADLAGYIV
ncbi:MAG: hypothetical protein K8T91_27595 [Planctomycetes bacterium]|nr:hypothetical protein [Planctomycetota bacterium]